jgi:hypothetical protein
MRALASKTARRPSMAIASSIETTIISISVKPDSRRWFGALIPMA